MFEYLDESRKNLATSRALMANSGPALDSRNTDSWTDRAQPPLFLVGHQVKFVFLGRRSEEARRGCRPYAG